MDKNDYFLVKIEIDALHISPSDVQYLVDLLEIIKRRPESPISVDGQQNGD